MLTESQTGSICSLVIKGAFPLCLKPTVSEITEGLNVIMIQCFRGGRECFGKKASKVSLINKIRSQRAAAGVVEGMLYLESKGLGSDLALSQPGSVTSGKSFNPSGSLFLEYKIKE